MTRHTLTAMAQLFCCDGIQVNPDGSLIAVNATAGACAIVPPVVVPPTPANQILHGELEYGPYQTAARHNVDLTLMDNLFGHRTATDALVPWMSNSGAAPCVMNFPRGSFIAARFLTPNKPIVPGAFNYPRNRVGAPPPGVESIIEECGIDLSISALPGDFTPNRGASVFNKVPIDADILHFAGANANPNDYAILLPNTWYYFNARPHSPTGPNFPLYLVRT